MEICVSLLSAKVNTACKPQTAYLCGFHSVNIYAKLVWLHWETLKVMEVKTKVRLSLWTFGKEASSFLHTFSVLEKWARGGSNVLPFPPLPPSSLLQSQSPMNCSIIFFWVPGNEIQIYGERVPKERDDLFLLINIFIFNYIIVKMRSALKTDLLCGGRNKTFFKMLSPFKSK